MEGGKREQAACVGFDLLDCEIVTLSLSSVAYKFSCFTVLDVMVGVQC